MKKMYKYIFVSILMMFCFAGKVEAAIEKTLCRYTVASNGDIIEIRYKSSKNAYGYTANETFDVYVNGERKQDVFNSIDSYTNLGNVCPTNVYWASNLIWADYCFDSDGKWCLDNHQYSDGEGKVELKGEVEYVYKKEVLEATGFDIPLDLDVPDCLYNGYLEKKGELDTSGEDVDVCYAVCYYNSDSKGKNAVIYYNKGKELEERFSVYSSAFSGEKLISFTDDSSGRAFMSPADRENFMSITNENIDKKICPTNFYYDNNGFDDVCFDSDGVWCVENVSNIENDEKIDGTTVEETDGDKKEEIVDVIESEQIAECKNALSDISSKKENVYEVCGYAEEGGDNRLFIALVDNKYALFKGTTDEEGNVSLEEITDEKILKGFSYQSTATCVYYKKVYSQNGFTSFTPDKNWSKIDTEMPYVCVSRNPNADVTNEEINIIDDADCQSLIGENLIKEIQSYVLYVKVAIPIIIIVLGSIDFGKAFIASDEDAMKKAQKHFITRLIIGMVIFFIPTLITGLLTVANEVWNIFGNGCGITF